MANRATSIEHFQRCRLGGLQVKQKIHNRGGIKIGEHTIKGWSRTHSLIALNSGEFEVYAALKAAAEGLGLLSMLNDLGWFMNGEVWGDARAALGIIDRRGVGKTRHVDTGLLWIQEVVARDRLKFKKVLGLDDPADLYTKYLDEKNSQHHTTNLACTFTGDRATEAPQLHQLSESNDEHEYGPIEEVCEWVKEVIQSVEQAWGQRQKANNNNVGGNWINKRMQGATHKNARHQEINMLQSHGDY